MPKDKIKKVVYTLGKTLGFLALGYIFYKLSKEYTLESFIDKFLSIKGVIVPLIIINLLSSVIGIYAWHKMLQAYATKSFNYISSYYYFAKTEISKYLPGNVFHFLSRQALASKIGISQIDMAKISLFFTLSLMVATVLSSTIFALFVSNLDSYIKPLMLLGSLLSLVVIYFIYPALSKATKSLANAVLTFSISLQGVMLSLIIYSQISTLSVEQFFKIASIYIISWLIGFVTPGASGGLGVREGAFLAISNFVGLNIASEIVLFSILLIRLINIAVDILMFLSTLLIKSKI
jgi:hypothetical protein